MKRMNMFLIGVVLLFGLVIISKLSRDESQDVIISAPHTIESVVDTSATALQKQANLVVMAARLNSVGTSKLYKLGMTAEQTDIATFEVRYSVDFSKISKNNFELKNNVLTVTLPEIRSEIVRKVKDPLYPDTKRYDNSSLLFSIDSTKEELTKTNNELIKKDLEKQSQALIPQASTTAVQVIQPLVEMIVKTSETKNIQVKVVPHV